MNNRDDIEYLKEKNNQALNNKNLLLERYKESGQDVFEKADPLYLKKIGVTYPTKGNINDEDIAEYRDELSELIGEFITSTATVKELINDMDDDEVQDLLVNWENVYKKIFESLEGQMIDYKKLRLTINKRLNERMYLERQSMQLKEQFRNKNPVTNATIEDIVKKLPTETQIQNNEFELSHIFYNKLITIGILGRGDMSLPKLISNLYTNHNNGQLLNRVSEYINEIHDFKRQDKITEIRFSFTGVVYDNGLLPEFKKFCKTNNINPIPITTKGDKISVKNVNALSNDQLEEVIQFMNDDVPILINETLLRIEEEERLQREEEDRTRRGKEERLRRDEEERRRRDEEEQLRRDEEERIRQGDELLLQLQSPQEVVEGPGEKGEPDEGPGEKAEPDERPVRKGPSGLILKDRTLIVTQDEMVHYGDYADTLVYNHWVEAEKFGGITDDNELLKKYKGHQTSDHYKRRMRTAIDGIIGGFSDAEITQNIADTSQVRGKKEPVTAKKTAKKVATQEDLPIVNTGSGLRSKLKPHQKAIKDKYYIDLKKLNANILEIRYTANKHLTGIKSQRISSKVREIILSMADGMLDEDLFKNATKSEQNLIRNIARLFKIDIDDDGDDEFDKEFEILIGQYESGNDSELLRKKIKSYISHGMKIGRITRKHGYDMLLEMSL